MFSSRPLTSFGAAVAGLALTVGAFAPGALAVDDTVDKAPRLLKIRHVPTAAPFSEWSATPVQTLEDAYLCEEDAFPIFGTEMRTFYNADAGTALTQYAARFDSHRAARKAVRAIKRCFAERHLQRENPGEDLRVRRYAERGLKDGLSAGIVRTRYDDGPDSKFLWSVGRDNRYVTLLEAPLATDAKAPKKAWIKLSKKALRFVAR